MKNLVLMISLLLVSCGKESVDNNIKPEVTFLNYVVNEVDGNNCFNCINININERTIFFRFLTNFNNCMGDVSLVNTEFIDIPDQENEIFDFFLLEEYERNSCIIQRNDLYLEFDNNQLYLYWLGQQFKLELQGV